MTVWSPLLHPEALLSLSVQMNSFAACHSHHYVCLGVSSLCTKVCVRADDFGHKNIQQGRGRPFFRILLCHPAILLLCKFRVRMRVPLLWVARKQEPQWRKPLGQAALMIRSSATRSTFLANFLKQTKKKKIEKFC